MKLTMKMKKRMEALEGNRMDLMKKYASLLAERRHLLDLLKGAAPILVNLVDDEDSTCRRWIRHGRSGTRTGRLSSKTCLASSPSLSSSGQGV